MHAYASSRVGHTSYVDCADPLLKHAVVVHLSGGDPPFARKDDVDYTLHELAYILERARPTNYIEIANTFPVCCQSMVAQFDDDQSNRSGVTHFEHTRNISMCGCCLAMLQDRIRKFATYYPELYALLRHSVE